LGRPADARYLSLRDGAPTVTVRERLANPRSSWKGDRRTAADVLALTLPDGTPSALCTVIEGVFRRMNAEVLPVAPVEDACEHCDLGGVCRIPRDVLREETRGAS
jgi:hypothetical protein